MQQCTVCGSPMAPGDTFCHHCGRAHYGAVCDSCGQPAPTLIRGGKVVCSGCGATRGPLAGVPLNMVGSAHRAGAIVTGVLAWGMILAGLAVGATVGLVVGLISGLVPALVAGVLFGGLGGAAGALTLWGSKTLSQRGQEKHDAATEQSVLAMAATRKGAVTTLQVAQNLGVTLAEADRVLTAMSQKGRATVEINAEGLLQYTFRDVRGALIGTAPPPSAQGVTGVRIDPSSTAPADVAKANVEREWEAIAERRRGERQ